MRKIIISVVILMLCPAAIMGYNAYQESSSLDALLLENVEALAKPAAAGRPCFLGIKFDQEAEATLEEGGWILEVVFCGTCDWIAVTEASSMSTC